MIFKYSIFIFFVGWSCCTAQDYNAVLDSLAQFGNCLTEVAFNDPTLGYVTAAPSLYCDPFRPATFRQLPGITCCPAQSPDDIRVRFRLFQPGQGEVGDLDWRSAEGAKKLIANKRVIFVIHGYLETFEDSTWMKPLVDAYVAGGEQVVAIDWRGGNGIQYFQAAANVRVVGMEIGHALLKWGITSRTLLVGFSLGAQVVGEAGKYVRENSLTGELVPECLGLDPAGPAFDGGHDDIRLDRNDCKLVQVVHSSAGTIPFPLSVLAFEFGTYYKTGHCDYWVNCGHIQTGCNTELKFHELMEAAKNEFNGVNASSVGSWLMPQVCSHGRAPLTLVSSVAKTCNYTVESCDEPWCGEGAQTTLFCSSGQPTPMVYPGLEPTKCTPSDNLDFMIRTTNVPDYCTPADKQRNVSPPSKKVTTNKKSTAGGRNKAPGNTNTKKYMKKFVYML